MGRKLNRRTSYTVQKAWLPKLTKLGLFSQGLTRPDEFIAVEYMPVQLQHRRRCFYSTMVASENPDEDEFTKALLRGKTKKSSVNYSQIACVSSFGQHPKAPPTWRLYFSA